MVPAITSAQVSGIMMKISTHKAMGIDGISARLLRIGMPAIAPCIARLINLSMSTGKFLLVGKLPKSPRFSRVVPCPIHQTIEPISVLPLLSKIIERHMHNSLYAFLTDQNLIYSRQSGFENIIAQKLRLLRLSTSCFLI